MNVVVENPTLLKPADAARRLRMSKRALLQNVKAGRIPCVRLNARNFRFHLASIVASCQAR